MGERASGRTGEWVNGRVGERLRTRGWASCEPVGNQADGKMNKPTSRLAYTWVYGLLGHARRLRAQPEGEYPGCTSNRWEYAASGQQLQGKEIRAR